MLLVVDLELEIIGHFLLRELNKNIDFMVGFAI